MNPRFQDDRGNPKPKVKRLLQNRHRPQHVERGVYYSGKHEWRVPLGVLYYWHKPLRRHQMVVLHPWHVTWRSQRTGRRLKKEFSSLPAAVHFVATKAQYADVHAAVVSKHPYDIIPALRGKLPTKRNGTMYYWCPLCVTARPYYPVYPESTFFTLKKVPTAGGGYKWVDRKVRVLRCRVCGCTNHNHMFRRSNQPWERRRFKRGARRARRTRR